MMSSTTTDNIYSNQSIPGQHGASQDHPDLGFVMEILYFRPNITPTGLPLGSNLTEDNPSSSVTKKAISWSIQTKVHHNLKTQAAHSLRLPGTMALHL